MQTSQTAVAIPLAPNTQPQAQSAAISPTFSTLTQNLLSASQGTTVAQASKTQMSKLWNDLVWMLGINTERQGAERMGEQLFRMTEYVYQHYRLTTLEDIRLAYDLGVQGDLGIDMISALNPLQFGKVMKAYKVYQENHTSISQRNNNQALFCELPPSAEYIDGVMISALRIAYQNVADGDTYPDFGNALYDWLDSRQLIPFDDSRKWEFYNEAKGAVRQLMTDRLVSSKRHLNNHELAPLRQAVKKVYSEVLDNSTSEKIRSHAKYLALNQLLKDSAEMGVTVDELLNLNNESN